MLLEAGASWQTANWVNFPEEGVSQYDRSIIENATGYRYGATTLLTAPKARTGRGAQRFSMSYVTGTHNIKVGVTDEQGFNDESRSRNNQLNCPTTCDGLNYQFLNGKPAGIDYYALPFQQAIRQNMELGIYAQDAWKIQRVTLNLGIRYDRISMGFPSADLPAGLWVPARHADARSGIPTWNDINPRIGAAIDVFGNGRTALRTSLGRYNQLSRADFTIRFHPFNSSINNASRTWTDTNGNYIPDCNLKDFTRQDLSASGGDICGVISNVNFGTFNPSAVTFDDSTVTKNRDFLWDYNIDLQHEIIHGLSLDVGYNHNWDGNFTVTDNTAVDPSSFDEFCITVPNDPRLEGAGTQRCGFYDIQPQLQGLGTLNVINAKSFVGKNGNTALPYRHWDGFWINMDGRLPRNIRVSGGIDLGKNVDDHCFTVDIPNQPNDITGTGGATTWNGFNSTGQGACHVETSWMNNLDFRFNGSVPIKGGFTGSFIFRNTRGAAENAVWTVTAANITFKPNPTTGVVRASTTLTAPKALNLITPNSLYGDRFNQLDLSINKSLNIGWGKLRLAFDLYNALNSNSIQNVTTAYSAVASANRWTRPTTFLDPRLARVTASIQF